MFEDDFDIDEILASTESKNCVLKRLNSETSCDYENANKKPKTDTSPNHGNKQTSTSNKKMFHFKKKENLQTIALPSDIKSNENDLLFKPAHSSSQSGTNKVDQNIRNYSNKQLSEKNSRIEKNQFVQNSYEKCNKAMNLIGSCSISSGDVRQFSDSKPQSERNIVKRRFPGPAGLLPERSLSSSVLDDLNQSSRTEPKDELLSQSSLVLHDDEPWKKMMSDFKTEGISLPEKFNIQWIKSRTSMKKLINQKAPFLAAHVNGIKSHTIQNPIVNLVLKDKTDTIQGTILYNLYEEHCNNLVVGSVIVLKDVGVLSTGTDEEPCLTITRNNLISIYSNNGGENLTQKRNHVSKVIIQDISPYEILRRINETKNQHNTSTIHRNIKGSTNLNGIPRNFRAVFQPQTPNLSVLRIKSSTSISSIKLNENVKNSPGFSKDNNEKINDIRDLFDNDDGIEEFFNDEPNFCSTQREDINSKTKESEVETCTRGKQENSQIFDDLLDGIDASALFDEF